MLKRSVLKRRAMLYGLASIAAGAVLALTAGMLLAYLTILPAWSVIVLCVLAGVTGCCAVGVPLMSKLVYDTVQPLTSLRDAAVKIAGGSMKTRASEHAPGEIGQLGRAINQISTQLSGNMYQLILERNRLKHILDNLSEGIIAVDSEGKITHRNPAVDALMATGDHISDVTLHRMDGGRVWTDFKRAIETGESIERTVNIADKVIRITIQPIIDEIDMTAGAVGMFSDITQLERLERTRREYVANVSHEMRTPLTAVRALVEPLKEGMVRDEEARMRYYDIILREVSRLTRLISDLMELSRLQSGTLALE